ncbi:MAG: bifunctional phosphopantothenoylcysteine decarboxylase/phosphopantothenate--cysteine ligase CoaBC [candidate division WOR-3 bacterium]
MRVLFGVTGSIAAHRGLDAARFLVKSGHDLRCVLTKGACEFTRPLMFRSLVGETYTDEDFFTRTLHIELSGWAECAVVAPATANILAKVAHGIADDLLSAALLAFGPPIIFAPAMHESMWLSPATQKNLRVLLDMGHVVLEPVSGELSVGRGTGRMRSPEEIASYVEEWAGVVNSLRGKRLLVAYGPTAEPLDPVRVITNLSSGRMGAEICRAGAAAGAFVTAVRGPGAILGPAHDSYEIKTAQELYDLLCRIGPDHHVIIMASAVADFRPKKVYERKLRRKKALNLALEPTPDILSGLPRRKGQVFVGFCLAEEEGLMENARAKMKAKRADLLVANDLRSMGAESAHFIIVDKKAHRDLGLISKTQAAFAIIREVARLIK